MVDIIAISQGGAYVELPTPSSYKVLDQEINTQAERDISDSCNLHKQRGAVKRQITMSWNLLDPDDFKTICELTGTNTCMVQFYDPQHGTTDSSEFYRDTSFDYTLAGGPWEGGPKYVQVSSLTLTEI